MYLANWLKLRQNTRNSLIAALNTKTGGSIIANGVAMKLYILHISFINPQNRDTGCTFLITISHSLMSPHRLREVKLLA